MTGQEATEVVEARVRDYQVDDTAYVHPAELPGEEGNEPLNGAYPPDGDDINLGPIPKHRQSRTTPSRILAFERSRRALEMRKAGLKFADIAGQLGYASEKSAYDAVRRAMTATVNEQAGELRAIQYQRLNEMLARYYPLALGGQKTDPMTGQMVQVPPSIEAARECRAIMQQINDLMGTVPDKLVNHRVSGGIQHNVDGTVTHDAGVIVVDFDQEGWEAALRRATVAGLTDGTDGSEVSKFELKPPSGRIAPALEEVTHNDEGIIDAEVISEKTYDPRAAFKVGQKKEAQESS